MTQLADTIEAAFKAIERAALAGQRCPITKGKDDYGNPIGELPLGATEALVKAGRLRIEIYPRNWRVAILLTGEHAGMSTKTPENQSWRPYRIITASTSTLSYRGR